MSYIDPGTQESITLCHKNKEGKKDLKMKATIVQHVVQHVVQPSHSSTRTFN